MADGYIDLSPIVNGINHVSKQVSAVGSEVVNLKSDVAYRIRVLKNDLEILRRDFMQMREENRRQAAFQRAITEIIRVRQELERDFGNYKQVRDTMLGILEATDLQLVRETTITSCTEELMLSTPRYWLAPVLIALSAWIADNKSLATRALREALRRDEEKTCLTFALICRRNKRTSACFEWLARYFARQKAYDMKESIIAYIDAYTNGVFGVDRDNLCDEYVAKWMKELQTTKPNFEEQQVAYWKGIYQTYCKDTSQQYPKLAECAKSDFAKMNDYVMRINAAPEIINFFAEILGTEVDQTTLINAIDNELIKLVKNYDAEEAPLREEEEYLTDIKKYEGDEKRANALRDLRRARRVDRKVDLASRLSDTITSNRKEDISAKKTAIKFMQGYIKGAFKDFIEEKAPAYPEEITISTHAWSGKTKDGSNKKELETSFEKTINDRRANELAKVKNTAMIAFFILAAVGLICAVVGFIAKGSLIALAVVGIIVLILFLILALVKMNSNKKKRLAINTNYDGMLKVGLDNIRATISQMIAMHQIKDNFDAQVSCDKLLLTEGI